MRSIQMQEILLQNQWDKIPSHGWGRRFNPYTAHHKAASNQRFLKTHSAYLGTTRQNKARTGTVGREKSVSFVRDPFPCIHFVGFSDDRYWNAVAVWGRPHFIHRWWDKRARREIAAGDTVVKTSAELKKWMDKQTDKELLLRATFVLQQWRRIERLKQRGKKDAGVSP